MDKRVLAVTFVLVAALLLRVGVMTGRLSYGAPLTTIGDESAYHIRALNLSAYGIYSRSPQFPLIPDATRSPGLSALLAGIYELAGPDPAAGLSVLMLLNFATVALLVAVGAQFWGWRVGVLAGGLLAIDLNHAAAAGDLQTESLSGLLVLAAVAAIMAAWRSSDRGGLLLLSGALWGAAALVHAAFTFVALPVAAAMSAARGANAACWKACGVWALGFGLLLGPWMARNEMVFDVASPIVKSGEQMLLWYESEAEADETGEDFFVVQERLQTQVTPQLRPGDRWQVYNDRVMLREGIRLALQHPGQFLKSWGEGFVLFFVGPNRQRLDRALPPGRIWDLLWAPSAAGWAVLLALAAYGLVRVYRREPGLALLVAGLSVYVALLTGPLGSGRFRSPLDGLFCLMAAVGIEALIRRRGAGSAAGSACEAPGALAGG